jgi:hypothetical protein
MIVLSLTIAINKYTIKGFTRASMLLSDNREVTKVQVCRNSPAITRKRRKVVCNGKRREKRIPSPPPPPH